MKRLLVLTAIGLMTTGCGRPNQANIELRRQIQQLQSENAELSRRRAADQATIASLQSGRAVETLPAERLGQLFTTHGVKLGRLTTGNERDPAKPDTGLQISFYPVDGQGDTLKAAGAITVQIFDLATPDNPLVGECRHEAHDAGRHWRGGLVDSYVLQCPFNRPPRTSEVTVRLTFEDALTGRVFTDQRLVEITPDRGN